MNTTNVHQGRNVRRFREIRELKQEGLAHELGGDWTQKRISLLEQREVIDPAILREVANALKVPVEALEKMSDEQAVNIFSNTFNDGSFVNTGHTPTINVNPLEEIKQLHEEKIAIYERMLKEKDEMMARLEKLLEKK